MFFYAKIENLYLITKSQILSSSKPEVKPLKRWITHEVIPTIRRAGLYITDEAQQREVDLQQITKHLSEKKNFPKVQAIRTQRPENRN